MEIEFIAGWSVIAPDPAESRELYVGALGLPLELLGGDYYASEKIAGSRHFGVWPLADAASSCFGTTAWPADRPIPQACVEFELAGLDAVAAAAAELEAAGYALLHPARTEPWGQTVARILSAEGLIVGRRPVHLVRGVAVLSRTAAERQRRLTWMGRSPVAGSSKGGVARLFNPRPSWRMGRSDLAGAVVMFRLVELAALFAEKSPRGMLTRAVVAWLLVGVPVIAARIWWSVPAALAIFVIGVAAYVTAARRYVRRPRGGGT